jgi:hypothetical protein
VDINDATKLLREVQGLARDLGSIHGRLKEELEADPGLEPRLMLAEQNVRLARPLIDGAVVEMNNYIKKGSGT